VAVDLKREALEVVAAVAVVVTRKAAITAETVEAVAEATTKIINSLISPHTKSFPL
jgi:hypothetical protein